MFFEAVMWILKPFKKPFEQVTKVETFLTITVMPVGILLLWRVSRVWGPVLSDKRQLKFLKKFPIEVWKVLDHTVDDGWNPANHLRLVVYPMISKVCIHFRWCRIFSINNKNQRRNNSSWICDSKRCEWNIFQKNNLRPRGFSWWFTPW